MLNFLHGNGRRRPSVGWWVCAVVALLAVTTQALALIANGSNAVNMFGQFDDDLSDPSPQYSKTLVGYARGNDGPNKLGLYDPHSSLVDTNHNRLFVADSDNHRILVYELDGSNELVDNIADCVIGQSNFATGLSNDGANRFDRPYAMAMDGNNNLYVSDEQNNRVLVFDASNISTGMSATYVVGQPDFSSDGTGMGAGDMSFSTGLAVDTTNNRLFVADTGNNRVLVFDIGSLDGLQASNVLGQTEFGDTGAVLPDWELDSPHGLAIDPDFGEK